ncbi:STAS domain-containing protein [Dactylosporangium sp. NPDC000521]|uniref:STAS domain-containing protein n=1 Tax=Dactylosporangium sp. NPDC000521 TaxID=3363975 RepID=UPI0036D07F74
MLTGAPGRRPIHLHVDLAQCPSVDAAGVDLLVGLHRRLRDLGGRLTLLRPSPQIRHLVRLSGPAGLPEMVDEGAPAPGEPSR